jgi:hypothetical protein
MPTGHVQSRPGQLSTGHSESLGSGRRQHLAGVIAGFVEDWIVALYYDEHGKAAIVIMPENPDDRIALTLIVSASGSAFLLDELRYDAYCRLGEDLSWEEVLRAVQIKLIWEGSSPTTLH